MKSAVLNQFNYCFTSKRIFRTVSVALLQFGASTDLHVITLLYKIPVSNNKGKFHAQYRSGNMTKLFKM